METRRVTFINQKTQSQKTIENSTATNLGELKAEMRAAGIDYEGMTFYEGHLRAELKDDASPLPTNIPYKGTVVNDLTFMLTTPEKKVKSGAMSRAEAYDAIKRLGLQDECKKKYGRNFTQCSTNDLVALVNSANKKSNNKTASAPVVVEEPVVEAVVDTTPTVEDNSTTHCNTCNCGCDAVKSALKTLVQALHDSNTIDYETFTEVNTLLDGKEYKAPKKMSKSEIDEMFAFVRR